MNLVEALTAAETDAEVLAALARGIDPGAEARCW